jgi:hypothetical protein
MCQSALDWGSGALFVQLISFECLSDWSDVAQRVTIAWTQCRFGGERPWFVCSVQSNGVYCGRQVTKLYGVGRLFACRHCYRLAYASQ